MQPRVGGGAVVVLYVGVVVVLGKMRCDVRYPCYQPACVARRAPGIGQAVPQADRCPDRVKLEAPRAEERVPVVPPSVARAYGPPPENPHTAARVMPSSPRMASTSAPQSAITGAADVRPHRTAVRT